jgi:hypothetical protein
MGTQADIWEVLFAAGHSRVYRHIIHTQEDQIYQEAEDFISAAPKV